jgi:TRAP-type uncharacterized transport system substrate-binding protein
MRTSINKLWPLLALILAGPASGPTLAADEPKATAGSGIVFSAGRKGGGYWDIAERLQAVGAESALKVEVLQSMGSIENLERLANPENPVNLTLSQADALKQYMKQNPGFSGQFKILESIGLECVLIVSSAKGDIKSDQDLQDPKGHRIAIPGERSGVAVTFDYMTNLVPGLDNTKPVYTDTIEAMKKIRAGDSDAVDAIMLVQRPKVRSTEIHLALDRPSVFHLVPVEDRHLLDELPNGETVYEFLDVPLTPGGLRSGKSVPTVCTKGLLLSSRSKLDPASNAKLKQIIDFEWMRVYPTDL